MNSTDLQQKKVNPFNIKQWVASFWLHHILTSVGLGRLKARMCLQNVGGQFKNWVFLLEKITWLFCFEENMVFSYPVGLIVRNLPSTYRTNLQTTCNNTMVAIVAMHCIHPRVWNTFKASTIFRTGNRSSFICISNWLVFFAPSSRNAYPAWRTGHPYLTFSDISLFFTTLELKLSYDVYQNWEELYSKYKWTKNFMTFDLLVGGAVNWAWRTGQEFTKYFWFAYFLWIFSSLDGLRRRQAYVAYYWS